MTMGTTTLATIQDTLSLPELTGEVILAGYVKSPVRQLAQPQSVSGTYRTYETRIPMLTGRASTGTETSTPAIMNIVPASTTCDPTIYEAAVEDTELAEITSAYGLSDILIDRLSTHMARKYTREFLQCVRGYSAATYNTDSAAASTANTAIVYTPKSTVTYANFGSAGATGTVAGALSSEHIDYAYTWLKARYQMPMSTVSGKMGNVSPNKLVFLGSPFITRLLLTGVSTTHSYYYRNLETGSKKYFDFQTGDLPGMIYCQMDDCEINVSATYSAEGNTAGGIKCNSYSGYHEAFILSPPCVKELTWREETVVPHYFTDEGSKRTRWTVKAYKNFVLIGGRSTSEGMIRSCWVPHL
jgi:hypothetical protein